MRESFGRDHVPILLFRSLPVSIRSSIKWCCLPLQKPGREESLSAPPLSLFLNPFLSTHEIHRLLLLLPLLLLLLLLQANTSSSSPSTPLLGQSTGRKDLCLMMVLVSLGSLLLTRLHHQWETHTHALRHRHPGLPFVYSTKTLLRGRWRPHHFFISSQAAFL